MSILSKRVLAIIPARGGSKRLPRKNVRDFLGVPLIAWTIAEAQRSVYIDTLLCSTDDNEIETIASLNGCLVSRRPYQLATDEATIADVVLQVLGHNPGHDLIVVLQPTSPLRTVYDIDCGITLGMSISVGPTGAPNGAVYVVETEMFKRYPYFGGRVFYMPAERSVDINTEADWQLAEEYGRSR